MAAKPRGIKHAIDNGWEMIKVEHKTRKTYIITMKLNDQLEQYCYNKLVFNKTYPDYIVA